MEPRRPAVVVGAFAVHLECPGPPPVEGDLLPVMLLGHEFSCEVVRVAEYRRPQAVEGGWATHFVKLRPRATYLEE